MASVVSLEFSVTTKSLVPLVVRETVPVEAGFVALSEKEEGVKFSESVIEGPPPKLRPELPGVPVTAMKRRPEPKPNAGSMTADCVAVPPAEAPA